jgi:hypothetical protein
MPTSAPAAGQSQEFALMRPGATRAWTAYCEMARGKTGQVFALPIEGAAVIAGIDAGEAAGLAEAALELGLLFQIQDDLLDLYGDKGRGLSGNDLREGKISALVATHIEVEPDDAAELNATLMTPRDMTLTADVDRWRNRFLTAGTVAEVQRRPAGQVAAIERNGAFDVPAAAHADHRHRRTHHRAGPADHRPAGGHRSGRHLTGSTPAAGSPANRLRFSPPRTVH